MKRYLVKMKIKIECKYYLGYKPCKFHKQYGRLCNNCQDYNKIEKKILIIKLDALGDVLRTTSILPALINKYPHSGITWITRKNAFPLLNNNPFIYRKFAVEENYLEFILNEEFDVGICLDADPLSATILSLAKCNERFGFVTNNSGQVIPANKETEEWYLMGINDDLKKRNRKTYYEIIYEICKLNKEVNKPQLFLDEESMKFAQEFFCANNLKKYKKFIGLNTGAGRRWLLKKWTFENYIKLIKLLKNNYPQVGIILFGGPEEIEFNKNITKEVGSLVIDSGCSNTISEFSGLISLIDIFLTPDSLGMHISIALNKTTIVLVGPTSPWELDVFGNGEIIYNEKLECISCYKHSCDKKINCMNSLKPESVLMVIEKYGNLHRISEAAKVIDIETE